MNSILMNIVKTFVGKIIWVFAILEVVIKVFFFIQLKATLNNIDKKKIVLLKNAKLK